VGSGSAHGQTGANVELTVVAAVAAGAVVRAGLGQHCRHTHLDRHGAGLNAGQAQPKPEQRGQNEQVEAMQRCAAHSLTMASLDAIGKRSTARGVPPSLTMMRALCFLTPYHTTDGTGELPSDAGGPSIRDAP
jgi:hypothetical protein